MTDPLKGYISLQEAADLLGLSRQSIYRRLSADSNPDTKTDSSGQPADSRPASIVHDKKRYVSMDWVLAEMDAAETDEQGMNSLEQPVNSLEQSLNSAEQGVNSSADRIRQLENDLLAAQGEAAALRATVKAQEAHIDSLQRALDAEQAIRMASLQKRLTAPGRGFMDWIRGRGKKQNDR